MQGGGVGVAEHDTSAVAGGGRQRHAAAVLRLRPAYLLALDPLGCRQALCGWQANTGTSDDAHYSLSPCHIVNCMARGTAYANKAPLCTGPNHPFLYEGDADSHQHRMQGDRWYRLPELQMPKQEQASAYADTGAPENVSVDACFVQSAEGALEAVTLAVAFWGDSTGSDVHLCTLSQPLEAALRKAARWHYCTIGLSWPRDAHGKDGPDPSKPISAPASAYSCTIWCTVLCACCRPQNQAFPRCMCRTR